MFKRIAAAGVVTLGALVIGVGPALAASPHFNSSQHPQATDKESERLDQRQPVRLAAQRR